MIDAKQPCEPFGAWYVLDPDGKPLCRVEPVGSYANTGPLAGIYLVDFEATRKRAEHIAEALRHYQQSQEGERVP
jgi:hypothetical protein